jgi:hypothetical protein
MPLADLAHARVRQQAPDDAARPAGMQLLHGEPGGRGTAQRRTRTAAAARLSAGCPAGPGWAAPGLLLHQDAPRPAAGGLVTRPGAARTEAARPLQGIALLCGLSLCCLAGQHAWPTCGLLAMPRTALCPWGVRAAPHLEGHGGQGGHQHVPAEDEVVAAPPRPGQSAEPGREAGAGRRGGAQERGQELEGAPLRDELRRGSGSGSWTPTMATSSDKRARAGRGGMPAREGGGAGRVHVGEDRRTHSKHKRWDLGEKDSSPKSSHASSGGGHDCGASRGQPGAGWFGGSWQQGWSCGGPPAGRWSLSRAHSAIWSWAYGRWNWAGQREAGSGATKRWAAHLHFFFIYSFLSRTPVFEAGPMLESFQSGPRSEVWNSFFRETGNRISSQDYQLSNDSLSSHQLPLLHLSDLRAQQLTERAAGEPHTTGTSAGPQAAKRTACSLCRSMGEAGETRIPKAGGSPGAGRGQDGPHKAGHAQQTTPGHGPHVLHAVGGQERGQVSGRLGSS